MTPEQFCYWLQGKLEGRNPEDIAIVEEIKMIQDHLKTVFDKKTPPYVPAPTTPYVPPPSFPPLGGGGAIC